MKMQFKTICQRHYNRTHTHKHTQSNCRRRNVKMKIIMKERRKMNYEVCELRTANLRLSNGSQYCLDLPEQWLCVREGQVNGIKMIVCVWVGVLSFGTRHAYNKPQMCRLSGQKCMQHISQFERGQRTKQTQGTLSWLWLCCGCATSTPTLNAWQLHQAVSYPCAPSFPLLSQWNFDLCALGAVGSTLLQAARVRALRHVYCDFMCH